MPKDRAAALTGPTKLLVGKNKIVYNIIFRVDYAQPTRFSIKRKYFANCEIIKRFKFASLIMVNICTIIDFPALSGILKYSNF